MTFLSWVRIEGEVRSVTFKTPDSGKEYAILRLVGEQDADCEIVYFGFGVAECRNLCEGDYVVVTGSVGVRRKESERGGAWLNLNIIGRDIRRVMSLPVEGPLKPKPGTQEKPDDDLPF
jgi:hypothetical protein